jgi:hypothetical protein
MATGVTVNQVLGFGGQMLETPVFIIIYTIMVADLVPIITLVNLGVSLFAVSGYKHL